MKGRKQHRAHADQISDEERLPIDWRAFVGNLIGVGAMLFLPLHGVSVGYELCDYDASICRVHDG